MSFPKPVCLALKFCMFYIGLFSVVLVVTVLMFIPGFILYFILPIFVFFTVFTIALRERDRSFPVREIMRDVFKLTLFKR
jgi:hypothetical protein